MTAPVAIILNPSSGAQNSHGTLPQLLRDHGIDAEIVLATQGADITTLAKQLVQSGRRTLVAAGGDGTVNAVAAAIAGSEAILGVLPFGTLNHFAKDLKLPLDLEGAVRTLKTGSVQKVDVAQVNGRIFVNNSGLGLYPSMVKQRERRRRLGQRKWIAFFHAAVATFRRFPFLEVSLLADGAVLARRTPFVFVGNNSYRMEGIDLGSRDSLTRGQLCLGVAQYRIGRWGLVRLAFRALFGRLASERDFTVVSTREVRISSRHKRLPVSLDGEVQLIETPLIYRIRPQTLRVIAPEAAE
jgi:diacylglycerol kinase family enzyme